MSGTPHPDDVTIGRQVRDARQALGLSQRAVAARVAERLGMPFVQAQLHGREHGTTPILAREYHHLADVLGLSATAAQPWRAAVPREVLATICHMLGVDPDRVSRINIYPDSSEIVDERSVAGRLAGPADGEQP